MRSIANAVTQDLFDQAVTAVKKVQTGTQPSEFEGFTNSATYLMSLYLRNDHYHYTEIAKLLRMDGSLDPATLQAYVEHLPLGRRIVMDSWAEGRINWTEITDNIISDWYASEQRPILSEFLCEVAEAEIEGNAVRLTRKLNRKLYLAVDSILQTLGGKWDRKLQAHVFRDDPTELIERVVLTGVFPKRGSAQTFGYFPTPEPLVLRMLDLADIRPGMRILEPQAGQGAIADYLVRFTGHDNLVTIELQETNAKVLREKGYQPLVMDFLRYQPEQPFDRIVMNPPFAPKQADIDHVTYAYSMLAPGGRLVSIMASSVTFRDNQKTNVFRDLVNANGSIVENEPGSFKSSGTGVNTVTVALDKPG